jgi:hypothetical protein
MAENEGYNGLRKETQMRKVTLPFMLLAGSCLRPIAFLLVGVWMVLGNGALGAWAASVATTTTLAITSGGNAVTTVNSGSVVTLTATVTAGGTPVTVGQVDFCDAAATHCTDVHLLSTAQLTKSGTASMKFKPGVGSHSYKAVFAGTPNGTSDDAGSTSSTMTLTVTGAIATTTSIAASGSVGNYSLTATVTGSGSSVSPTGSVSFLDTSNGNAVLGKGALGAGTTGLSFLNSSNPVAGINPYYVAVGDFNGDGIPDLAVVNLVNGAEGSVTILLGNGNGTFTQAANSPVSVGTGGPNTPSSVVVGDFNGDGIPDLAVAGTPTVTILLGNGDGTFTPAKTSPAAGGNSIAVGDFNGDGILDLAVADNDGAPITILLGKGDGTFTQVANGPVTGFYPNSIVVGDFNGDGIPDLVVAGESYASGGEDSGVVTILLGNGNGTFTLAANSPLTVGTTGPVCACTSSVAVGDFNRDGISDLAVSNFSSGTLTILMGHGDGTFTQAVNSPINVGSEGTQGPISVAVGDFNGDGVPDLVVAKSSIVVLTLLGNGDGTFTELPALSVSAISSSVAVGDFNGDGFSDLAVASDVNSSYVGSVTVMLAQLSKTAKATATGISPVGTGTHLVEASYPGDSSYNSSVSGTTGLTAVAPPSFTVSGTAVIVSPGATTGNTSTITVTPAGGFTGSVTLTAAVTSSPTGAQYPPTFSFGSTSPASITGTAVGMATLTITTTAATNAALVLPKRPGAPWFATGSVALACLLLFGFPARRRRWRTMLGMLALLLTLTGSVLACGGGGGAGGGGGGTSIPGTTAGTYTITVTGTSGSTTAMGLVTLTVQ